MGLDMYAFARQSAPNAPVDFPVDEEATELHYWRKHPDLHGWMRALYTKKGGTDADFNVVPVVIDAADLDQLEKDIEGKALPSTSGFFFGQSYHTDKERADDRAFIAAARKAISEGLTVYYYAWW